MELTISMKETERKRCCVGCALYHVPNSCFRLPSFFILIDDYIQPVKIIIFARTH